VHGRHIGLCRITDEDTGASLDCMRIHPRIMHDSPPARSWRREMMIPA